MIANETHDVILNANRKRNFDEKLFEKKNK